MVIRQRQRQQRAGPKLTVYVEGFGRRPTHSQDGRLRPKNHRRKICAADAALVGNGESAAFHFIGLDFFVAGAAGQIGDVNGQFEDRFVVGVAHHRHQKAARRVDRQADVDVFF